MIFQRTHPLKLLSALLKKAQTTNRKIIAEAVEALKDCFVDSLLPDRKLLSFKDSLRLCELGSLKMAQLLALYKEHRVKELYYAFVEILEKGSRDTLLHFRKFMMRVQMDLLVAKPEREEVRMSDTQALLSNLVNKLGSPEADVCVQALQLLQEVLKKHSNMMSVVLREVDVFMKSSKETSPTYYGFQVLSGAKIPPSDTQTLALFFKVCFDRFSDMVQRNQLQSKTVGVILSALNKKLPFVDRSVSHALVLELASASLLRGEVSSALQTHPHRQSSSPCPLSSLHRLASHLRLLHSRSVLSLPLCSSAGPTSPHC